MPNRTGPAAAPDPFRRSRRPRPRQDATEFVPPAGENLVLVQFKGHRKGCYHNRRGVPVGVGDYCLVEADRGRDLGRAVYIGTGRQHWWRQAVDQGIIALARPEELAQLHENRGDEWRFYDICQQQIQERNLPMDLVTVERQFDHNKITFYFTAEKRVDFRELVKDLAGIFRTRIELRQIGVRDEARLKGGLGVCGRALCCSSFLDEFVPVTLKMAKDQQLPLSPNKLSGVCGRLRCCITYEHTGYQAAIRNLPRVGATVHARGQEGTVRKLDLVREQVTVFFATAGETAVLAAADLAWDREQDLPAAKQRPARRPGRRRH
jgi:cell fate regulator YaaT (PSP1 superfamily)